MHLIRLELYGFKSFADKVEFSFSPGITTFVGPNGCGKSNVVDAIRWVLGEQNPRVLRANKMADLIYGGTEQSEQKNFAEVVLVLDNRDKEIPLDYREVSLARRYYRSGESEYFLNRVPCRLKDIAEVLASTPLGKGTYSIIGQGQVAEVISSRPEDRRLMIEEAAGIALYKLRKGEALKKLGDTQGHLDRLDDIIHELSNQEEELGESAATARTFLDLKARADELELSAWAAKYAELQQRLQELEKRRLPLLASREKGAERVRVLEGELADIAGAVQECVQVIVALESNHSRLKGDKTQQEYQLELARQRQEDFAKMVRAGRQRLLDLENKLEELKSGQDRLNGEEQAAKSALSLFTAAQARRGTPASLVRRLLAAAEKYRGRADELIFQAAKDSTAAAADREKNREQEAELAGQLDSLGRELGALEGDLLELKRESEGYEGDRALAEDKLAHLNRKTRVLEEKLAAQKAALVAGSRQQEEKSREVRVLEQRISVLEAMDLEMQGVGAGARTALRASQEGRLSGILGLVGELVRPQDPRHSLAIETALGGAMQYLVCKTDEDCRRAIELLKAERGGRATFLPLTAARAQDRKKAEDFGPAVLGWADQLVCCPQEAEPAMAMLLGNVLVVEDLKRAAQLAQATRYRHKIVTIEGEVISRGLFTGGFSAKSGAGGPLQRRAAREELAGKRALLAEELLALEREQGRLGEEKDRLQAELDQARAEQEGLARELVRLETLRGQGDKQRSLVEERRRTCRERLAQLEGELSGLREAFRGFASLQQEDKAGLDRLQKQKEELNRWEGALKDEVALWSSRQNSLHLAVYSWQNQGENIARQLSSLANQVRGLEAEGGALLAETDSREKQTENLAESIAASRQALAEIAAGLDTVSASLEGQFSFRSLGQKKIQEKNAALAELRQEIEEARIASQDLEVKKARFQTEAEALAAQLLAQHGLSPEKGLAALDSRYTPYQLANRAKEVQEQISRLGEVNLAAISQYDKLCRRLSFLAEQREDLARASQDITGLIAELDKTIRTLFQETFSQVQEHFARIFKILFAGGSAYLALREEEDLLEAGVEVFARPLGKRSQSLTLLSGGEMAMTAIALLFALQSVRPSPFCILDEIEAALDDSNILRFTGYLRGLAEDRQFILITHRRETMEQSDSLYGITLNKEGASQPISVKIDPQLREVAQA